MPHARTAANSNTSGPTAPSRTCRAVHAEAGGVAYVEIEIRQDLIGDAAGQQHWAGLLKGIFPAAVARSGILAG